MRGIVRIMVVCGVGVCLALAGCTVSTPGPQPTVEPSLGVIPVITAPEQVSLPIYSYLPSVEQTVAVMLESQALVNQCAQADGSPEQATWSLWSNGNPVGGVATTTELMADVVSNRAADASRNGMWQFFNPATVEEYGYTEAPEDQNGVGRYVGVEGSILSDCVDRVSVITPGGMAMQEISISSLPDGGPPWHADDSRFVAVEKEWSVCMQGKGFSYATPEDAMLDNTQLTVDPVKAKAVAVADVGCKVSTNVVGVGVAVQSAYEQLYIDQNRDALTSWQGYITDFLAGKIPVPSAAPTQPQSDAS